MYKFFYNYPICPNCLTPADNYSEVKMTDEKKGTFRCENCGAHFYNRFIDKNFNESLYWNVNLNKIEKAYFSFLNEKEHGKYLITWPWEEVNFSPILASDYLIKNPEHKVVIVDKLIKQTPRIYKNPSIDVLFDHLFFIKKVYLNSKYDEKSIVPEKIFESRKKFYCEIKVIKENQKFFKNMSKKKIALLRENLRFEADYQENKFNKFKKDSIKKIEKQFSDSAIKSTRDVFLHKLPKIYNELGLFELKFKIDEGIDNDVKISDFFKREYGEILPNTYNLNKVSDNIKSITIHEDAMFKKDLREYNLIFIDDTIDTYKLIKFISKVNPDVTIFNRADLFFERSLIFNRGLEFNDFVKNSNNTILLFSTFRDNRALYKIGEESSILNELNVIPHTWDYKEITNQLKTENDYISLGSSSLNDVKSSKDIHIEYFTVDGLDVIESSFSSIMKFYKNNRNIRNFLFDLLRTPLYLSGYFRDKKVFRKHNLSFESLFASIYNRDEELGIELDKIYDSVYHYNDNNINPITDKITNLILNFNFNKNDKIICVVDTYEIKGLKEIIEMKIKDENILSHITYSSWDKLIEFNFEEKNNYYIISTRNPYITFKLNNYDFKKIYFVGSPSTIEHIKIEVLKRLTEHGTMPLFVFEENDGNNAPQLLTKSINNIEDLPPLTKTKKSNIYQIFEYEKTEDEKPSENPTKIYDVKIRTQNSKNKFNISLESDDDAILVISKNEKGMFLPLQNNVYIKNMNGEVEEIKTSKDTCNQLINKKIVLDSEGFYTSFRLLFFRFISESKNKIPIINSGFQWNNFKSLLNDTFKWLEILRKISIKYEKSNTNLNMDSKYKLALDISKLKLHAKDPDYISKFWLSEPVYIETSEGDIPIYENEHPKTREDLITLFQWINENFEDINLSPTDANRSYYAAITLQKIRRDFLRKRRGNIPYAHLDLYYEFEKNIDRVLLNADSFEVSYADIVKINGEITPYKVVNDYKKYLK